MPCQLPPNAQHRAVAPNYQAQVTLLTDSVHVQCLILGHAGVGGGFAFKDHFAVLLLQKKRDVLEYLV